MPITRSLRTTIGKQNFLHQYLNAPQYPVNLMGCDVLVKCGASVLCGPDGLTVTFPDRTSFQCSAQPITPTTQMPLQPDTSPELAEWEDIYAGLLEPESKEKTGVLSLYQDWTKWIDMLHPYAPPPNPLHVTLYYDRDQDDVYKDAFTEQIQGVVWHITSSCLYSGSEGVAAPVDLINEQMEWYEMAETADLHVSLAIRVSHQAKDLGPMVKRLNSLTDWAPTNVSGLFFSLSDGAYKIVHATRDVAILQHSQIERFHGRERTDHPDTEQILQTLPHQLWVVVIYLPYLLTSKIPHPFGNHSIGINLRRRREFQKLSSALEPSSSSWNTPILPVSKPNSTKYRMAHDPCRINDVILTPPVTIPSHRG